MANYRYWIASTPQNWSDTNYWSTSSGGSGGASIPSLETIVTFDSNGNGNCALDTSAYIYGLFVSGYSGTISQNNQEIRINTAGSAFSTGSFIGAGNDIRVAGDLYIGGSCQFTSTDSTLSCDSTFSYSPTTGFFDHNYGIVSLDSSGCALDTSDIAFSTLQFNAEKVRILDSFYVEDRLILKSGSARITDSTSIIHLRGDLTCESAYNSWTDFNSFPIWFDRTDYQNIEYNTGGVIPYVVVDRTAETPRCARRPYQVTCNGDSPVVIKDGLWIKDGTFNTNGLDVQIGLNSLSSTVLIDHGTLLLEGDLVSYGNIEISTVGWIIPVPDEDLKKSFFSMKTNSYITANGANRTITSTAGSIIVNGLIDGRGAGFESNRGPGCNSLLIDSSGNALPGYGASHAGLGFIS